jgi:hypothetical protein
MADLLDDEVDEATTDDFDPASLPLGTFTSFDVSDQPMYTTADGAKNKLDDDQKNAIRAMVESAAKADSVARRIEVQTAWLLQLLDRGFHNCNPDGSGGWNIQGQSTVQRGYGIWGAAMARNNHPTNVIGEKNDTIVALLTREIAESTFFATRPGDPDDETFAAAANCLKHFLAEDNKYGTLQAALGRLYCTDECAVGYTRPVADAQKWGYEDVAPDVVPETADNEDPDAAGSESNRPKIRTVSEMFGKLYRKVSIISTQMKDWSYCGICKEYDIAKMKAEFPWIASKITAGDLGIAEIKLDRLARQSINLSMQSQYATGDSLMRDVTKGRWWMRPEYYMDDSCPKTLRSWFWETFPKGFLAVYAGGELAFVRNESMDEVLTEFHARSGNGQNRRALTESYAGPQLRVNVLVDLWDEFCRKEIPRVGLDKDVWNVTAIRSSSVRVGVIEPFQAPGDGRLMSDTMVQFPQPTHTPTLPDFIMWLTGPLAEQLTHAQQGLAGSQDTNDPEMTATESRLKQNNAMSSFGETWKNICEGFANMTTQGVSWNARVQPEEAKFDTTFKGKGRVQAQMKDLKMGSAVARADGSANFPESWDDRQRVWDDLLKEANQNPGSIMASWVADPRNLAAMREFLPKNMVLAGVDAVEKQQGEFDVLLKTPPVENPQYLKISQAIQQGTAEMQANQVAGLPPDPQKVQLLQQAQQALQQMPPQISSVPVRPTDNHPVEALVCNGMINGPEGRRLASSQDPKDQAIFQNLMLHYQQHDQQAKAQALQNTKPVPPKTSITVDPSKLPPQEQAAALQIAGIPADAQSIQGDQALQPHEVTTTEKGVSPTGSELERKTSVVGKSLS